MKEMHAAGITPYLLKVANYYAMLGIGEYFPKDSLYRRVVVRQSYPWKMNDENIALSMSVLKVEFLYANGVERSVEFCVMLGGWAGPPLLQDVSAAEVDPKPGADGH